ncbi:hypothetical protein D3C87_1989770 [compost metagenome]
MANANSAPEITPGAISGSVTRRNAVSGDAPRLAAARTRLWLKPCNVADTVMITNGTPSTACTTISEKKLLPSPSGAKNR